jgi:acyl-CoA synthetase (AMP-forming)/AMP-acid ligase II
MWNFGDIIDAVAASSSAEAPATIHDGKVTTWPETKKRMDNLARGLAARGLTSGDKVAFYLRNGPAYAETAGACFLASLTHCNINYRYNAAEVYYVLDNADAAAVVYDAEFRAVLAEIRPRLTKVRLFIEVGAEAEVAPFALSYEALARETADHALPERTPDNEIMIYTGGTTGMPKGVVLRQGDLTGYLLETSGVFGTEPPADMAALRAALPLAPDKLCRWVLACPQMHGTALWPTMNTLLTGGCLITVGARSLDPHAIWTAAAEGRATNIAIVGDPFARPLLQALDAEPGRYDLSALRGIGSSGAMWSAEVKAGLLGHLPQIALFDSMSSTEAMGIGASVATRGASIQTGVFSLSPNTIVIDDEDRPMQPGTGVIGRLAVGGGVQPVCYYKDPEKSAKTFKIIEGRRYSVPGDLALLEADGSIKFLGRGNHCINTAGEKVFPEEVEEALKRHPSVEDALVIGSPDEKWGQVVTGVVRLRPGAAFDEAALRACVREQLASYKAPKRVHLFDGPLRGPNGKADYKAVSAFAAALRDSQGAA